MSLLDATAYSVNTIFAQLIAKIGVRNVQAMAHHLGITEQRETTSSRRARSRSARSGSRRSR